MLVYGRNVLIEALRSSVEIHEIILEETIREDGKIAEILALASQKEIQVVRMDRRKLEMKIESKEHQGVAASVNLKTKSVKELFSTPDNLNKSYIYISEATYEHNVGAIIRTAEAAGFGGVVIPNDIKITPTVVKISAGAALRIPILSVAIYQAIKDFKEYSFEIVGIEREGEPLFESKIDQPAPLIIGGEDKSLSDNLRERCDKIVEIPQSGKINSLNMSVAAGIIIYEHLRQLSK